MSGCVRIDGRAFHTYTRGFQKPFDMVLMRSMQDTMQYLCENIQGCVLGYTQSDEITLLLVDYKKLNSAAWFDYEVQKLCSIAASMATMVFNRSFAKHVEEDSYPEKYAEVYQKAMKMGATFDARCFNIPKEEVTNLIYWRSLTLPGIRFRWLVRRISHTSSCRTNRTMTFRICSC